MKHVGIDIRMAHYSGIGRYIRNTINALGNYVSKSDYSLFGNKELQSDFQNFSIIPLLTPIYSLQEQIAMPTAGRGCDCLHIPHYNAPLCWKKKLVVTIHDLIH